MPESGPYKIVWDTNSPTSLTRVNRREIWINKSDIESRAPAAIAHEIAHSKLLGSEIDELPEQVGKVAAWRELEAVLFTIGKQQSTDSWVTGSVLLEVSRQFGDGSFTDSKRIAKTVTKRLGKRGFLTKAEVKRVIDKISGLRLRLSDYN